jgi:hypothetical protein
LRIPRKKKAIDAAIRLAKHFGPVWTMDAKVIQAGGEWPKGKPGRKCKRCGGNF